MINKKGFTLIELLVVITIIGILAVAFLPALLGAPSKARDTQRVDAINDLASFLLLHHMQGINLSNGAHCVDTDDAFFSKYVADFGGKLPSDPDSDRLIAGGVGGPLFNFLFSKCSPGEYFYGIYDPNNGGLYTFFIIADIENEENGNISCTDWSMASTVNAAGGFLQVPVFTDSGDCYAIYGGMDGVLYK